MGYKRFIRIISQAKIPQDELSEAMCTLIELDINEIKTEDFAVIHEFILDMDFIEKTQEEKNALMNIVKCIENSQ